MIFKYQIPTEWGSICSNICIAIEWKRWNEKGEKWMQTEAYVKKEQQHSTQDVESSLKKRLPMY